MGIAGPRGRRIGMSLPSFVSIVHLIGLSVAVGAATVKVVCC